MASSTSKIDVYKKRFKELDIEKKGALTRETVAQILSEEACEIERLMVILLFERYDDNMDKLIQEDEFIRFCTEMETMSDREIMRKVFDIVDEDKNQKLDVGEVQKLGIKMGLDVSWSDAWATVDVLDVNRDNNVDFDEFCALIDG